MDTVEEAGVADVRDLFETHFLGTLRVTIAPPNGQSKRSTESLAQEVKGFAIKLTLLEPGAFATDSASPSLVKIAAGMDVHADLRKRISGRLSSKERGDPKATAPAILKIVDAEHSPLRLAVGAGVLPRGRAAYADRLAVWEASRGCLERSAWHPTKSTIASL